MKGTARFLTVLPLLLALVSIGAGPGMRRTQAQGKTTAVATVTSPEAFFGFRLGSDRKIARWDRIVEYYKLLAKESSRIRVVDMGPSTEGNPFLLVVISSPANLAKLERLREVNLRISDPRGIAEADIRKLVGEGKVFVCQSMSLHASEIGGTQMAPELAYDLLLRTDEDTLRILDNVVFLEVPSFNPDGQIMVTDWYNKWLGTEYEGSSLPWLYHKYTGHDNNRDAFQTNMIESRYMAKILFTDWKPQAYLDHHHMGSYGARIYVPPYAEPIRPLADPLVWREMSWYGAHIAYKEEQAGLSGVINMSQYSGWGHFGFHWITPFHNIAGMLTESASARLATPLYIDPSQLQGGARNLETYKEQTNFPDPWPGGWWRLRDIVDRQKVSAWALLDIAARDRETVLWNAAQKALRQTERGATGKPAAYVIPAAQHDSLTATTLVKKLLVQGIDVMRSDKGFTTPGGVTYGPGSWVVPLAQPKMGLIRYLLGRTLYPDNEWTRNRDGSPIRPYDMAADVMAEFMGVRVDPLDEPVKGALERVAGTIKCVGNVDGKSALGYSFDGRLNDSFRAANLLFAKGVAIRRVDKAADGLRPGDFIVGPGAEPVLEEVALATGVDFTPLKSEVKQGAHDTKPLRIGMYQRFRGGNMDEGWTRWLLEQFGFRYTSVTDAEIKQGGLGAKYDVFILPDDSTAAITGEPGPAGAGGEGRSRPPESTPPEYRSGIGTDGVNALKAFVQKGGTLVTLGGASAFGIEKFSLPVRNVVASRPTKEFFCPGSTLRVTFDNRNPLAYGMPPEGLVLFHYSPAFEVAPTDFNERYEFILRYADRDLLQSGWLIGEENLVGRVGMLAAKYGEGKVVLIGFRTQNRAQTHGTFKLLFNALVK